jgi:GNAT superfamily N-acetyltransferase
MKIPDITIGNAAPEDLPAMIAILAEGQVPHPKDAWNEGSAPAYRAAFDEMMADPRYALLVARQGGEILGMLQINFTRALPDNGGLKAVLESVFVAASARGLGIGRRMVEEAERLATARGARRVQLTSNKVRVDAHRFYRTLGYTQGHEGFSKSL